jgi:hypothetical protein
MKNSHSHIAYAGTTVVSTGAGVLKRIVVNTTANGAITVYDSESATGRVIAILKASVAEGSFEYDVEFGTGLTVVTAAASDITVVFA